MSEKIEAFEQLIFLPKMKNKQIIFRNDWRLKIKWLASGGEQRTIICLAVKKKKIMFTTKSNDQMHCSNIAINVGTSKSLPI